VGNPQETALRRDDRLDKTGLSMMIAAAGRNDRNANHRQRSDWMNASVFRRRARTG